MARASAQGENAALNGLDGTGSTNYIGFVGLYTVDPTTLGTANEATGGSYARQACTWNAASGGSKTNSTSLTFSTGGVTPVTHFGACNSATVQTGYTIGGALTSSVTAASITIAPGAITLSAS